MAAYINGVKRGCYNCAQYYGSIIPCSRCRGYSQWREMGTDIRGLLEEWENKDEDEV